MSLLKGISLFGNGESIGFLFCFKCHNIIVEIRVSLTLYTKQRFLNVPKQPVQFVFKSRFVFTKKSIRVLGGHRFYKNCTCAQCFTHDIDFKHNVYSVYMYIIHLHTIYNKYKCVLDSMFIFVENIRMPKVSPQ